MLLAGLNHVASAKRLRKHCANDSAYGHDVAGDAVAIHEANTH
jgi:hypothetical protein